jgi:type VI protein secretion system component Hcp
MKLIDITPIGRLRRARACAVNGWFLIPAFCVALSGPCVAQPRTTVTIPIGPGCGGAAQFSFPVLSLGTAASRDTATSAIRFADVTITRTFNDCSVWLNSVVFRGTLIPTIVISSYAAVNGQVREVMRITLSNAVATSIAASAGSSESVPSEQVTFTYQIIYVLDVLTGRVTGWDRNRNAPV